MPRTGFDTTFDADTELKDAGVVAASAGATVGGVAKVLDLGLGRAKFHVKIHVSAIADVAASHGVALVAQVSNNSTFAAGTFPAAACLLGDVAITGNDVDTVAPVEFDLLGSNDVNGTVYRYLRMYTLCAPAGGSVNYSASLVLDA